MSSRARVKTPCSFYAAKQRNRLPILTGSSSGSQMISHWKRAYSETATALPVCAMDPWYHALVVAETREAVVCPGHRARSA